MTPSLVFTKSISVQHMFRQARHGSGHTSSSTSQTWVVSSLLSSELLVSSWGDTKALSKKSFWFKVSIEPQAATESRLTQHRIPCLQHLSSRTTKTRLRAKSSLPSTTSPIWSSSFYALSAAACSAAAASPNSAGAASTSTRSLNWPSSDLQKSKTSWIWLSSTECLTFYTRWTFWNDNVKQLTILTSLWYQIKISFAQTNNPQIVAKNPKKRKLTWSNFYSMNLSHLETQYRASSIVVYCLKWRAFSSWRMSS